MHDLIRRVQTIRARRYRWYDWGHRVMVLVAREDGGSFDGIPRVRDLWFHQPDDSRRLVTARDYADVRANPHAAWRVFDSQNDGHEIVIGWWPNGHGNISRDGLSGRDEQRLFARWWIWDGWVKAEWCGLRRWLYFKALHAVVHERIPFACQVTPDRDSGGYDHWYCQLRRRHNGDHRYRNYTWAGPGSKAVHSPMDSAATR